MIILHGIKIGDTLNSVVNKLGTPFKISWIYERHLQYTWERHDATIIIECIDNQVVSKNCFEKEKK